MSSLSAVIITLNEESNLPRCLQSLQGVADEIIVVDSFSTDNTVEVARAAGARIVQQKFEGYGPQKAAGTALANGDWLFIIDADEALSDELRSSILALKKNGSKDAYEVSRLTNYCGAWIRHGGWYPDRVLRLWRRGKASQNADKVHEKVVLTDGATLGLLAGELLHYSFPDFSSHLKKVQHYSESGARFDAARGKKVSMLKLLFGPWWVFVQMYLLKGGLRDGYHGFVIAVTSAFAAFAKYVKIREYSRR